MEPTTGLEPATRALRKRKRLARQSRHLARARRDYSSKQSFQWFLACADKTRSRAVRLLQIVAKSADGTAGVMVRSKNQSTVSWSPPIRGRIRADLPFWACFWARGVGHIARPWLRGIPRPRVNNVVFNGGDIARSWLRGIAGKFGRFPPSRAREPHICHGIKRFRPHARASNISHQSSACTHCPMVIESPASLKKSATRKTTNHLRSFGGCLSRNGKFQLKRQRLKARPAGRV